ncbi:hypothetical protein BvCmsKKP036_03102 [Escherichia coli]|nr:hypothetical protein BvCmsKKP036_03102 [Escherichia coli]
MILKLCFGNYIHLNYILVIFLILHELNLYLVIIS